MDTYIFQADLYCKECAERIKAQLDTYIFQPDLYDSDDYPKGPYPDGGGEADYFQHCAGCGLFLDNALTKEGIDYTIRALQKFIKNDHGNVDVLLEWAESLSYLSLPDEQADIVSLALETLYIQCDIIIQGTESKEAV